MTQQKLFAYASIAMLVIWIVCLMGLGEYQLAVIAMLSAVLGFLIGEYT